MLPYFNGYRTYVPATLTESELLALEPLEVIVNQQGQLLTKHLVNNLAVFRDAQGADADWPVAGEWWLLTTDTG
jgi:hypothetical protein